MGERIVGFFILEKFKADGMNPTFAERQDKTRPPSAFLFRGR